MIKPASPRPRSLSFDEAKAAEAAYQGQPFNESWSQTARVVYDGVAAATQKLKVPSVERHAVQASTALPEQETDSKTATLMYADHHAE
ncbi:MAG: hypothetical protein HY581_09275 [Nitrospirae bacterium]|nr:hypothetical protein [Nitrospirota bacterium]